MTSKNATPMRRSSKSNALTSSICYWSARCKSLSGSEYLLAHRRYKVTINSENSSDWALGIVTTPKAQSKPAFKLRGRIGYNLDNPEDICL